MAPRDEEMTRLRAELAEARSVADICRDGVSAAGQICRDQRQRAEKAEAERDALKAAVARVRQLHVRNANTGDCEHCSERDYPNYAVPWPCATIRALATPETPEDEKETP